MTSPHGGNLRALARQAGCAPDAILDFSANVNPLGPPAAFRRLLSRAVERLVHYPDPQSAELVEALARRYGVPVEQIVVGNGSSELLFALPRACPFRRAVIPTPTYVDYATAAATADREIVYLPLDESQDFALDLVALDRQLTGDEAVFLGQPNNPTGRLLDVDALAALVAAHPRTLFVIDEAFADFVPDYRSPAAHLPANVVLLHSLTKFYAMPGLRLGFAIAPVAVAAALRRQIPPWSVNTLAQEVAPALLADAEYACTSIATVASLREALTADLTRLPGLYVYPGVANYLLVRLNRGDIDAPALAERLLREGIAIRTFGPGQYLDPRHFRLAVRTAEENQRLCAALAAVLGVTLAKPAQRKRRAAAIMLQGTSSNAGKSVLTAALCRILLQDGRRVAPFKSQNMSLNSYIARDGGEMGRAQVVQAQACRLDPDVRMNPVLLKPNSDTGCQVIVRGQPVGNMRVGEYVRYKPQAFQAVRECYDSLAEEFDAIVLEGAGSPGEVNLKSHDIVNMQMARYAGAPVLVVGDIDRGGVFASFVGTMEVLEAWERRLVAGWIVNRFRGDASLLDSAFDYTLQHTGRPVLGVVPYLRDLNLPQEDSVEFKSGALDQPASNGQALRVAVIDLPHISNFTDFDPLGLEPDVTLRIVRSATELSQPDVLILPGSKNTLADLAYLHQNGLADRIGALAREGRTEIVGICGGLQMLGREIADPLCVESSAGARPGLGLLGVRTTLAAEKTLQRTTARHAPSGLEVQGYEIHHGQTPVEDAQPVLVRGDGQVVGVAAKEGRLVWGTYLHGIFDADAFRRWFLDQVRQRRGWPPLSSPGGRFDIEPALDRLADVVRRSLNMDAVYRLLAHP